VLFFIYGVVIYERHTKSCWRRKKTRWLWTKLKKIRAPLLYVFSRDRSPWYGTFPYETKSHVGFLCWQHLATLKFWGRKNNLMDWKDACTELFGLAVLRSELDRRVERTKVFFFLNFSWANNNTINQRRALEKVWGLNVVNRGLQCFQSRAQVVGWHRRASFLTAARPHLPQEGSWISDFSVCVPSRAYIGFSLPHNPVVPLARLHR